MAPSQYRLAAELVEMIHEDFQGFHPGYRGVHAQGRYYASRIQGYAGGKEVEPHGTSARSACPGDSTPWIQRIW